MLSPFMPFISEELWQRLARRPGDRTESICVARYPKCIAQREHPEIDSEFSIIQKLCRSMRSLQTTYNIQKKHKPHITLNLNDATLLPLLEKYRKSIITLAYLDKLEVTVKADKSPKGCAADIPDASCEIYLHIKGLVDIAQEIKRLTQKLTNSENQKKDLVVRMTQADYTMVPQEVRERNEEKLASLEDEIKLLENAIQTYKSLEAE